MKYSKLCPYSCLFCKSKYNRFSENNEVKFYCKKCNCARLTYCELTGKLLKSSISFSDFNIFILYGDNKAWVGSKIADKNHKRYSIIKITNFDLSNKENFLNQLKTYLTFQ